MGRYGTAGRCFRMCGCMTLIDRLLRKSAKYGGFSGLGIYILKQPGIQNAFVRFIYRFGGLFVFFDKSLCLLVFGYGGM